jgi:hypothetical protein
MIRAAPSRRRNLSILASLCGAGVLFGCAQPSLVVASIRDAEIAIDGAYEDWGGRFTRIDGRRSVGIGIANDADDLYLCLVTRDLGVQTLLRRGGFTMWLDPAGGQEKKLGLRVAPIERSETSGEPGEVLTPRIEIVRDGAEYGYQLAKPGPDGPVDAKTSHSADVIAYEFRIALGDPLAGSLPSGLRASLSPGKRLGVGVITDPLEPVEDGRSGRFGAAPSPLQAWVVGVLAGS